LIFCSCLSTLWQKSLKLSFSLSYCWGPPLAFDVLDEIAGQSLGEDILQLIREHNRATDGAMVVPSDYLEIVMTR
ncbi:MAG: hypothetical protein KZQ72_08585, partial [Candidatus Thiodiazotropha sp. (ex Cardiolucina cf. quadrata)]|nr:hypothetical protein [Candidatus Thiodiazotropha sp. (ex Cardiolucina cf. quadrata)]